MKSKAVSKWAVMLIAFCLGVLLSFGVSAIYSDKASDAVSVKAGKVDIELTGDDSYEQYVSDWGFEYGGKVE